MTVKIQCKPIPLLIVTLCASGWVLYRIHLYSGANKTMHPEAGDKTMVQNNFATGGDALDYFDVARDAMKVTWAHAVNDRQKLDIALKGNSMMVEADIRLRRTDGLPVTAHDSSDVTPEATGLQEWLEQAASSSKGLKLDIKSVESLEPTLKILRGMSHLHVPIWFNADVLVGPNSDGIPVNATQFFTKVQQIFPNVTLSPGWTTGFTSSEENKGYSQEAVEKMYSFCRGLEQLITFPVRASLTAQSLIELKWLVNQSEKYVRRRVMGCLIRCSIRFGYMSFAGFLLRSGTVEKKRSKSGICW